MEMILKKSKGAIITTLAFIGAIVAALLLMLFFKVRMLTILGVVTGLVTAAICMTISRYFEEGTTKAVVRAVIFGVLYAVIYITVSKTPVWLAMIMLAVAFTMMGYLVYWWKQEGSAIKELIAFMLLYILILRGLAMPAAAAILDVTQGWAANIVLAIPKMVVVICIGYLIANMIWFKQELNGSLEGGE